MKSALTMLVLLLVAATPARAGFFTAGQLLEKCANDSVPHQLACVFYIAGAVDASQTHHLLGDIEQQFCLAEGVDIVGLRQVYVQYARVNAGEMHLPATGAVLNSFIDAFPCE